MGAASNSWPDGRTGWSAWGGVFSGGIDTGYHDPLVTIRSEVLRMLRAAAQTGSLISNGHQSFWNRTSPQANALVIAFAERCR